MECVEDGQDRAPGSLRSSLQLQNQEKIMLLMPKAKPVAFSRPVNPRLNAR